MASNLEPRPKYEKNLAGYGLPPLAWKRALERLQQEWRLQAPPEYGGVPGPHTHWLVAARPDGRPLVMPVGVAWHDGAFYFTSGPGTRKAKNLALNPECVVTLAAGGIELVLEGQATRVKDDAKLRQLAGVFGSAGWEPTVRDGAYYHEYGAPSTGPPPWVLSEFRPRTVFGLVTAEPYGTTRWRL